MNNKILNIDELRNKINTGGNDALKNCETVDTNIFEIEIFDKTYVAVQFTNKVIMQIANYYKTKQEYMRISKVFFEEIDNLERYEIMNVILMFGINALVKDKDKKLTLDEVISLIPTYNDIVFNQVFYAYIRSVYPRLTEKEIFGENIIENVEEDENETLEEKKTK